MRLAAGQAVRDAAHRCGWVVHRLVQLFMALVVVAAVVLAGVGYRLSQGPVEINWLARRLANLVNAGGGATRLSIGSAALAWEGLGGVDRPLDIVVKGVRLEDGAGNRIGEIPRATVSLGLRALLRGRIVLRAVDMEGVRLRLLRARDGATTLDLGDLSDSSDSGSVDAVPDPGAEPPLTAIMKALSSAPDAAAGDGIWSQLRRLRLRDGALVVADEQLGVTWRAPTADLDLVRSTAGGASGLARITLALQGEVTRAEARLALLPEGAGLSIAGSTSPFVPARLAPMSAALAPLGALDAPVGLTFTLSLDGGLALLRATLQAQVGGGVVHVGDGIVPFREAVLSAEATPGRLDAKLDRLVMAARPEAEPTTIAMTLAATRANGRIEAAIGVDIDQVAFTDLPVLWPIGIGGPGTRPWITKNLTAGVARRGHVEVAVTAPDDFSDAVVTSISGGMDGTDVTGHWLRPVPPIEHGEAKVVFVDPDTMDVLLSAGTQAGTKLGIRSARVRLTGLAGHDQFIAIDSTLAGPFADVLQLLRNPKIKLLDRRPIDLRDPAGQIVTRLTVTLPLKNELDLDNVAIHATGKLTGGHLGGIAAGRDLDRANLDVDVSNDGLKLGGTANVSAIPTQLQVEMDFREGGPAQILQKVTASATADQKQLLAAGLDAQGLVTGPVSVTLAMQQRRDGAGEATVKADLTRAALDGGRVPWTKAAGRPGFLEASVTLAKDRIVSVRSLRAEAPGLQVLASAEMAGGQPSLLRLQRLVIGEHTNLGGSVRLPVRAGLPYDVVITGPSLDLSGELDRRTPPKPEAADQRGPAFTIDARLDRVLLSPGRALSAVVAKAENDGVVTRTARISGQAGQKPGDGTFSIAIAPVAGGRTLSGTSEDAGALLRALDVMDDMRGGQLSINGRFDDTKAGNPLTARAEIAEFRIQNAPAIARLLQGMSLYGLLEVAKGPGLGFTRLVAPFMYRQQIVTLSDARAYSASLGMTAKGTMDLRRHVANIEGTVVPVYALNTALGRLPLVGRIFSPEEGGGLFAVSYSIRGVFEDPTVIVNPLSVLTPGFLRGFFDIFDSPGPDGGGGPLPKPSPPRESHN